MTIIKIIFSFIWQSVTLFWKYLRKVQSVVGSFLFLVLIAFFIVSALQEEQQKIPDHGALVVSLEGAVHEQKIYDKSPLQALFSGVVKHQTILREVIKSIDLAAKDNRITMMIVDTNHLEGAMPSKLHSIGQAMERFKKTGKKIYTYGDSFSQNGYLVAVHGSEIYLNPYGSVLLYGYSSYQNYFKGFLDKIKAEVQLFRVGKYKSAMEPFIRRDMSPAAKEASQVMLGNLWMEYTDAVVAGRALDKDTFLAAFDTADKDIAAVNGDLSQFAIQHGLVDGLKTRTQWVEFLAENLGVAAKNLNDNIIGYKSYLAQEGQKRLGAKNVIAVVYVNGMIMDGDQPQGIAGGDTVARHLAEARLNDDVKAVILRVDSPGGSAFASEIIRQEILELQKAGKPVVVSMGSLAASGGYWVSASADEIWAAPTTITGSIGIFGAIPNFEGTLDAIGITTDGVGTTSLSTAALSKPLPNNIKSIIQNTIENGYDRFLDIVAKGRHMTKAQVNEIAQGRVWTGNKALEIGLIDKLGTFEDAVKSLAARANLKHYDVVFWEDPVPWDVRLISDLLEHNTIIKTSIGHMLKAPMISPQNKLVASIMDKLSLFNQLNDPNYAYVLCAPCLDELEGMR